jgi:O-antigen ligase
MLVTLLTKSSGGTIVSMSLFFIWLHKKKNSYIYYLIGVAIVYFAYVLGLFDLILEKLSYNFDYYDLLYRSENHYFGLDGSFVWRLTYWLAILFDVIYLNNSSVWFGLGFETMSKGSYYFNYMITDPHNDYLRLFAELGIVGFSLMISFIFIILKRIWRWELLVVMLLPMCIGNILVNVPYMMLLLITGSRSDSE